MAYIDSRNESNAVIQIQRMLRDLDYIKNGTASIGIDGIYDVVTREAVMLFQADYGLDPTGVVNYETWQAMNAVYKEEMMKNNPARPIFLLPKYRPFLIEPGMNDTVIYAIQHILTVLSQMYDDFGIIEFSGVYDPKTVNAVKVFQRKNLIDDNGIIDTRTFNRMADEYEKINSSYEY